MSFTVYILYSSNKDHYYIGQTKDLNRRFKEHNSGQSKSTMSGIPWEIAFIKQFHNRSEAIKYESYLKRMKSRSFIAQLIQSG